MFLSINSTVAFTALSRSEQAAIWNSFFEALDHGTAGLHPMYDILAPRYAAGDYIVDPATEADFGDDQVAESEMFFDPDHMALAAEIYGAPAF